MPLYSRKSLSSRSHVCFLSRTFGDTFRNTIKGTPSAFHFLQEGNTTTIPEQMSKTVCLMHIAAALVFFMQGRAVFGEEIGVIRLRV